VEQPPTFPPMPRAPRRGRGRRITRRGWATLTVLAALAVAGGTGAAAARTRGGFDALAAGALGRVLGLFQPQVAASGSPSRPAAPVPVQAQEPISVLVMGIDDSVPGGPRDTDSMMVMSYDPQSNTASVLSVPRDLWVDVPGDGYDRINTAYENGGVGTAELTVEQVLGIPIEYYALVDYAAFVKLVDDVGGIDVNVPYAIDDSCYPNADMTACTSFHLAAGPQHLDGQTALMFARERHAFTSQDIQRESDQQLTLLALKAALLQPKNLLQLPAIIGDLEHLVQTNLPYSDLPTLANEVLHLPPGSITTTVLALGTDVSPYTTSGGAEVLLPNQAAVRQAVAATFPALLRYMRQMSVQVQYAGASEASAASDFTAALTQMGAPTLPPAEAPAGAAPSGQVALNTAVLRAAGRQAIPTEAYILGQMLGSTVQKGPVAGSQADIVVTLGSDFLSGSPSGGA
jgi:LCP family protein required for cell wall assembly